ncbi:DEAD/DEAH box helicase [Frankia nepalensis]|uniref:DEAD/DEAH box helicase n=1 Tax=Frankia nepalensis TaxID=1836974 RepID=A0A937UQP3_9ACTN|nr:DEAD/DEAH box helicase [Frankia nepalensis]MBL7499053.1 DEAD/DEAH box helicase [Frankia nepalensis]MBL7514507.1 DEAD/DEAH box helicase [Frankia nepalensis]MBL7632039.1 DEAD/DEAH box helicase [Frankia nepalensis]
MEPLAASDSLVEGGWREHLDWIPEGLTPDAHQAVAFERLSTKYEPACPTVLITGPGTTDAFLVPVLDHCRLASTAGQPGVKALLLCPTSTQATGQAGRLDGFLQGQALASVTAGLYLGGTSAENYRRVLTDHAAIRRAVPDVLITTCAILDRLLQRPEDVPLWQSKSLAYAVLNEIHLEDGARRADIAMLLRRLGAVTAAARPGRPLGLVCPVVTSAAFGAGTFGAGTVDEDAANAIRALAEEIFGVPFEPGAVVGENRLAPDEVPAGRDSSLPGPDPVPRAAFPVDRGSTPPATFLSAIDILRRQYVAHLVDLAARGRLAGARPLPRLAGALFGTDGWLAEFTAAALTAGAGKVERFLALFAAVGDDGGELHAEGGSFVGEDAATELRAYAVAGLAEAVAAAEQAWEARPGGDPARAAAHATLVDLGLLPNYALPGAALSAESLSGEEATAAATPTVGGGSAPTDGRSPRGAFEGDPRTRLLDGLRAWVARADTPGTVTMEADLPDGTRVAELRLAGPARSVTHWRMRLRPSVAASRAGVQLTRLGGPPVQVVVYLDGFGHDARAGRHQLADDADRHSALRARGVWVYQLTWNDVEEWRARAAGVPAPPRPPYQGPAQEQAQVYYRAVTSPPRPADELDRLVWVNPVDQLLAFLADPDPSLWRVRAQAALGGLLRTPGVERVLAADGSGAAAAIGASLRGAPLPAGAGKINVIRARDDAGCPVTLVVDDRAGLAARVFSAFVLVDDGPEAIGTGSGSGPGAVGVGPGTADEASTRERRRASWLAWANLIQFLADGAGDAVALTVTGLDGFDPTLLAAAGRRPGRAAEPADTR